MRHWLIDGNNVFGSRPDGWWNDRAGASRRLSQRVAEWCRGHDDEVVLVFDRPVEADVVAIAGGNLRIEAAPRRGRDAADDRLVELASSLTSGPDHDTPGDGAEPRPGTSPPDVIVVTSDKGLIHRLPSATDRWGVGRFRRLIDY